MERRKVVFESSANCRDYLMTARDNDFTTLTQNSPFLPPINHNLGAFVSMQMPETTFVVRFRWSLEFAVNMKRLEKAFRPLI
jgi:hypothetical protein